MSWLFQRSFDLRIFYKVQFSHSVMSDSLRSHGLQHTRLPCTNSWSLLKLMSTESVKPSNHLILCHPLQFSLVQFSSAAQSCPTLWDPMDCSMPGFPVHHKLPELAQTHVHWVSDAIQPSPLSSPSPAFNLSQHQDHFQWVNSSHQVAKVLEFQVQHQSFQWIFRTDFH